MKDSISHDPVLHDPRRLVVEDEGVLVTRIMDSESELAPAANSSLNARRIFVVQEDDKLYCQTLKVLRRAGAQVFGSFSSFCELPPLVPEIRIDLALVDMDGQDRSILRVLAELARRGVPVVLLSDSDLSNVAALVRCTKRQLIKPVTADALLECLNEIAAAP